jgi:hypothetical protein
MKEGQAAEKAAYYSVGGINKMKIQTGLIALAIVPLLLISSANAQVENQSSDAWHLWVFLYNVPPTAHNVRVLVEDNNTEANVLLSAIISPDRSVADSKAQTAMWVGFNIHSDMIGNGTAYQVCFRGDDIKSVCAPSSWHNGNLTSITADFDYNTIPKAGDNSSSSTSNNETNANYQGYHGTRV